jgi:phage major head subunit gpT-like protein
VFDDIVSRTTEFDNEPAAAGLQLHRHQLEDTDANGPELATHWSQQIGAYAAYWPQKSVAAAIKANPVCYDGLAYFHSAHPLNPFDTAAGTYANLHATSGGASGVGAVPIDTSVTVDVALNNLNKVLAHIKTLKTASGQDPRGLVGATLFVPPLLMPRAVQLTDAKFIAQAAAAGGGSADVTAVLASLNMGAPVECPELALAFGGSDVNYYVGVRDLTSEDLGAFVYVNRDPFAVTYHNAMTDAELARSKYLQWETEGRNKVHPGHPYKLHKCNAA